MDRAPLEGFTVGVTADRRAEDQAILLRRLGAEVVFGRALDTQPPADEAAVHAVTEALVAAPPDDLIANTGFGIRAWLAMAEGWGLAGGLVDGLRAHTRIAARGAKAVGALRSAGLPVWWRAPDEELITVGRHLAEVGVAGRRVALQLHGDDRQGVTELLEGAGATVIEVPVYRWELPPDGAGAAELIRRATSGRLDAITFTAGPQVRNLLAIARGLGLADQLLAACNEGPVLVACVGPVCARAAAEEGLVRTVVPDQSRLGAMVKALAGALAAGPAGFPAP